MSNTRKGRRLIIAGALAATAAIGSVAPAQADAGDAKCDVRLERLEAQFRAVEERRGYEAAAEWWAARWHAYFQSCVI